MTEDEIANGAHPTACEDCDNVHMDTRKLSWSNWQCVKFPKVRGLNPVAPNQWTSPPYNLARNINMGHCPLWTKRRVAPVKEDK